MVLELGLHAPNAEGLGVEPWSGKWIPHTAARCSHATAEDLHALTKAEDPMCCHKALANVLFKKERMHIPMGRTAIYTYSPPGGASSPGLSHHIDQRACVSVHSKSQGSVYQQH